MARKGSLVAGLALLVASTGLAQPRRVEIARGVSAVLPTGWTVSAVKYRNALELVRPARQGPPLARMLITTEQRRNHEEARTRLKEIAREFPARPEFLLINGWPALQRRHLAPVELRGQPAPAREAPLSLRSTTAIAAGNTLLRLETSLLPGADPRLADEADAIARSVTFTTRGPASSERELQELRQTVVPSPVPTPVPTPVGAVVTPAPVALTDATTGAAVNVRTGNGELEIVASPNGQNVVIAANPGWSRSTDGGVTFAAGGGTPGAFPRDGDPSLALGDSGSFYYAFIGFPNGTAAANNVTGCSTGVARSDDNGATFPFINHAVLCPQTGAGMCFPDQEHIAADATNAAAGNDQVYSVWRNFVPSGTPASCNGINQGFVTASIVCSTDSAANWTLPATIGTGDFPRVTVGSDGFVYVAYRSGANVMVNKFSSCANGLAQQVGFPVTVAAVTNVTCPVAGLDRCNSGNTLSSQTVAVDDTNPNHVYVAYATNTAAGNENVIVHDSVNGGAAWSAGVPINSGTTTRRFMPWLCSVNGDAFVTWYDRTASTAAATDLTDFYIGSASVKLGALQGGPEQNLSVNPDPQCATGFPCGARAQADLNACPAVAGALGGGCPKYGDYNGNACIAGRIYTAWASATNPPGITAGTGLRVFSSTIADSDFYVRDWTDNPTTGDDGAEPSTHSVFYQTSDVWNRRSSTNPGAFANGQPENEDAGNGAGNIGDNWAYARIRRNNSPATGSNVVRAHFLVSKLGTGSNYADAGSADPDVSFPNPDPTVTFDAGVLGPTTTAAYKWHLNAVTSTHLCLAVEIAAVGDPFAAPSLVGFAPGWPTTDQKITADNNKAQRNMGLSTTPAVGATGTGGTISSYAIAHNAGLSKRDMVIRYTSTSPDARHLHGAMIEVLGGEPRPFASGGTITLSGMQPGENRWIGITMPAPSATQGSVVTIQFDEMRENTVVNGFSLGTRSAGMNDVLTDNLDGHRSVLARLDAGFRVPEARQDAAAALALRSRRPTTDQYLAFLQRYRRTLATYVGQIPTSKDPFALHSASRSLDAALGSRNATRAALAHTTLLNRLDAYLTMQQLAEGDTADILQTVRWTQELYTTDPRLRRLPCAAKLLADTYAFVNDYGLRRRTNKDYPALVRTIMPCLGDPATPQVRQLTEYLASDRQPTDLGKLQRAHRDRLMEIHKSR